MRDSDRPKPASGQPGRRPARSTLAAAVGGLPLPGKLAKPPSPPAYKRLPVAPPRLSAALPPPPKPATHASSATARPTVAGRLGSFAVKRPSPGSPKGGAGRKRR